MPLFKLVMITICRTGKSTFQKLLPHVYSLSPEFFFLDFFQIYSVVKKGLEPQRRGVNVPEDAGPRQGVPTDPVDNSSTTSGAAPGQELPSAGITIATSTLGYISAPNNSFTPGSL